MMRYFIRKRTQNYTHVRLYAPVWMGHVNAFVAGGRGGEGVLILRYSRGPFGCRASGYSVCGSFALPSLFPPPVF